MRVEQLTFTRFVAAISIVIFHFGKKSYLFNNEVVQSLFFNADVCVSYFFILSGFVMMLAYGNKNFIAPKDYFIHRLARIYPVYIIAILFVVLIQIRTGNLNFTGLFLNILMIQAWVSGHVLSINPPGWSLSVEILFYICFPVVFNNFFKKTEIKKIFLFIILFWILSQVLFLILFPIYQEDIHLKEFLKYSPIMHFNQFLIGNLAGFIFINNLKNKKGNYDVMILILTVLVFFALKTPINFHNGLLAILFIPLILFISLNTGLITKIFALKIFVFLGEISFGIYILQFPVFSIISAYSITKYLHVTDVTLAFFIRLILLIIFAAISYLYIEKPIRNLIKANAVKVSQARV